MAYIDSFNINKTEYDANFLRNSGLNEVTSLDNLPINKRMIHATLSKSSTLSIQDGMEVGEGLIIICECSAIFEQKFTSDNKYIFIGEVGVLTPIYCQEGTMFKIYVTKSSDSSYVINLSTALDELDPSFTIRISKIRSDPSSMVSVDGNPEIILSQFRRCLCKKVSDNNVKICYLNDSNSNQYHDGTTSKTDGTEGDVMVYFPELWYLGTDTDTEYEMNISMTEKSGYKHAAASLVGAYGAHSSTGTNSSSGKLYSRSGIKRANNIAMVYFAMQAQNRGKGYHIIDYQQHNIMIWMFYAKYKNTNSINICGPGSSSFSNINCGVTNSLGIKDTTPSNAGKSSNMLVNFLGIEGCWGCGFEFIEGIHTYRPSNPPVPLSSGIIAYDKGDYHDIPQYEQIPSPTKRILKTSMTIGSYTGFVSKIKCDEYMDIFPTEYNGIVNTYFCGICSTNTSSGGSYIFYRGGDNNVGSLIMLSNEYTPTAAGEMGVSRLAFDGNIEVVEDVNTFKSLPVL